MLFPNRRRNPGSLMVIGMSCLVVAILWQNAPVLSRHFTPNWNHFLQGVLFGLSIALNLMSIRLAVRQRRNQSGCSTA